MSPALHKGDDCGISWQYASVTASPNYIIAMRFIVDGKLAFQVQGFFQTSMYVADEAFRGYIHVKCGKPGTNPDPVPTPDPTGPSYLYGNVYSYIIQARDSANMKAANYGVVYCPPKGK
jgi:hypothetical protein